MDAGELYFSSFDGVFCIFLRDAVRGGHTPPSALWASSSSGLGAEWRWCRALIFHGWLLFRENCVPLHRNGCECRDVQVPLQQCFEWNMPSRFRPVIGRTKRESRANRELSRNCKSPAFRQATVPLDSAAGLRRRCAGGESQETCPDGFLCGNAFASKASHGSGPVGPLFLCPFPFVVHRIAHGQCGL